MALHLRNRTNVRSFPQTVKAQVDDMHEWRDQMLGHQSDKLSWYVIWSGQAVRLQTLYLSKHFLMGDVTETEGGMRVICKTIDQPVDVLVEHRR